MILVTMMSARRLAAAVLSTRMVMVTQAAVAAPAGSTQAVTAAIDEGEALLRDGKVEAAIKKLKSIKAEGKLEARRSFHLARARARAGDYVAAIANAQKAAELDDGLHAAHFNTACYQAKAGQVEAAGKTLETLTKRLGKSDVAQATRTSFGRMIDTDPDLAAYRATGGHTRLVDALVAAQKQKPAKSGKAAASGTKVAFNGCGKRDEQGQLSQLYYNCMNFDGAEFSDAPPCRDGWVKIDEAVPADLVAHLEQCIYEL